MVLSISEEYLKNHINKMNSDVWIQTPESGKRYIRHTLSYDPSRGFVAKLGNNEHIIEKQKKFAIWEDREDCRCSFYQLI